MHGHFGRRKAHSVKMIMQPFQYQSVAWLFSGQTTFRDMSFSRRLRQMQVTLKCKRDKVASKHRDLFAEAAGQNQAVQIIASG
ncbi:MAG: hypothetical protein RLZZ444_980 [Pseudomonadota bacterium]|jgi:hypothetical protein